MQGIARGLFRVTREAVVAGERQTVCFRGIRTIMVEHNVRVIVPFQGVIQHEWPPAGNSGRCLNCGVVPIGNRANPAFVRGSVP